jgi:hypothetical protein
MALVLWMALSSSLCVETVAVDPVTAEQACDTSTGFTNGQLLQINKPTPKFTSLTPSQPLEKVIVGEPDRKIESVLVLNLYFERLSDVDVVIM